MTKKVSFIVAAYNVDSYIEPCVRSLLAQHGLNDSAEIIVIDDGSKNPVESVLSPEIRSRVNIIRQENQGLPSARNAGLRVAKGEYVSIIDGDDAVLPYHYSEIARQIELNPFVDVFIVNAYNWSNDESIPWTVLLDGLKSWDVDVETHVKGNVISSFSVARKAAFSTYGFYDESMRKGGEDFDLWLRFLIKGAKFRQMPAPTYLYRVNPLSMTRLDPLGVSSQRVRSLEKLLAQGGLADDNVLLFESIVNRAQFERSLTRLKGAISDRNWGLAIEEAETLDASKSYSRIQKYKLLLTVACLKIVRIFYRSKSIW